MHSIVIEAALREVKKIVAERRPSLKIRKTTFRCDCDEFFPEFIVEGEDRMFEITFPHEYIAIVAFVRENDALKVGTKLRIPLADPKIFNKIEAIVGHE